MIEDGKAPCGNFVDDTRREKWRQEFSCNLLGCEKCSLWDGKTVYYKENIKKGLSIWAKHQLETEEYKTW